MPKTLELVIPCEPAGGPELVRPIYLFIGFDDAGAARCEYQCPHCGARGPRVQPMRRHMGMVMNVPACCPVLLAQDESRRIQR